jgi:hypothetical protein
VSVWTPPGAERSWKEGIKRTGCWKIRDENIGCLRNKVKQLKAGRRTSAAKVQGKRPDNSVIGAFEIKR